MSLTLIQASGSAGATPAGVYQIRPQPIRGRRAGARNGWKVSGNGIPVQQVNPGGNTLVGSGGLLGNPNYPCVAGPEIQPLASATVPVDLGTEYLFDFKLPNTALGTYPQTAVAEFAAGAARQQHWVAFDLYSRGNAEPVDTPTTLHLPPDDVTTGPDTVVSNGGLGVTALYNPGGDHLVMDGTLPDATVGVFFDPEELVDNFGASRIVRIGLRYLAWRSDDAPPGIGEGLNVSYVDLSGSNGGTVLYGSWAVTATRNSAQVETRWLGEVNAAARGKNTKRDKHPFTVLDLQHMESTDQTVGIVLQAVPSWDGSSGLVYLDFLEMVVEVIPERRLAAAIRGVSSLDPFYFNESADSRVDLMYALNSLAFAFPTTAGGEYTFTVREAIPADPSDRYRAIPLGAIVNEVQILTVGGVGLVTFIIQFEGQATAAIAAAASAATVQAALIALSNIVTGDVTVTGPNGGPWSITFMGQYEGVDLDPVTTFPTGGTGTVDVTIAQEGGDTFLYTEQEAFGPSLQLKAVTQARASLEAEVALRTGTYSNGVMVGTPEAFDSYSLGAFLMDPGYKTVGAWWAGYIALAPQGQMVADGTEDVRIRVFVDGTTTYDRFKLLAKPDAVTVANLQLTVQSPLGVDITTPILVTPASVRALDPVGEGWREFSVSLAAPITPPSGPVFLVASSPGGAPVAPWYIAGAQTLGGPNPQSNSNSGPWGGYDPTFPGGLYPSDFAFALLCAPPAIAAPTQTAEFLGIPVLANATCGQENISYASLSWPSDPAFSEYAVERDVNGGGYTRIAIVENTGGTLVYNDWAAPWDVALKYRLVGFRPSDRRTVTSAHPVVAIGPLSSDGAVLGISDATDMAVYLPGGEGALELAWTDLTTGDVIQQSGENFNRILHAPEDRGLALSATFKIWQWRSCQLGIEDGVPYSRGALSLDPTPFDLIRGFSREEFVHVRFPGGMTRTMLLQLGGLSVRTQFGLYRAEIILTDAQVDLDFGDFE